MVEVHSPPHPLSLSLVSFKCQVMLRTNSLCELYDAINLCFFCDLFRYRLNVAYCKRKREVSSCCKSTASQNSAKGKGRRQDLALVPFDSQHHRSYIFHIINLFLNNLIDISQLMFSLLIVEQQIFPCSLASLSPPISSFPTSPPPLLPLNDITTAALLPPYYATLYHTIANSNSESKSKYCPKITSITISPFTSHTNHLPNFPTTFIF